MADPDRRTGLVGELLQFHLPEPNLRAVGPSAIAGDHQATGGRLGLASHCRAPTANGIDGEWGGVVINADADATGVRADVVNSVRNGLAEFLVDEVVHVDLSGQPWGR
jgi:hypothetical protein